MALITGADMLVRHGRGDFNSEEMLQGAGEGPAPGMSLVEDALKPVGGTGELQLGQVGAQ